MIIFPPAKINIGLRVHSKRRDGYHNIETIMLAIGLRDALELVVADADEHVMCHDAVMQGIANYTRSGISYPGQLKDDLVVRAWHAINQYVKKPGSPKKPGGKLPQVKIHLHKCIPVGAGLGGGSADAAAMLILLAGLLHGALPEKTRMQIAASLGSDCSFFMQQLSAGKAKATTETKAMLATGRGNILKPVDIPALTGKYLVVVCPPIHISTKEAYRNIRPSIGAGSVAEAVRHPVQQWPDLLRNDFETNALLNHPTIGEIKNRLYAMGACYASMSGTGSAVYGLFEATPNMEANTFPACFTWTQHL